MASGFSFFLCSIVLASAFASPTGAVRLRIGGSVIPGQPCLGRLGMSRTHRDAGGYAIESCGQTQQERQTGDHLRR